MLRLWSRGEIYWFDSFGLFICCYIDIDRIYLYFYKICYFDKDWICICLYFENKKKFIYRFEFLWFINFLYVIIYVKFLLFCNVKIMCGDFFWYECVFIKFIVLVFLVIGIFICVGFVGVEVNIVLLIWKIDIFVDICEKIVYFDKWNFFMFKKI